MTTNEERREDTENEYRTAEAYCVVRNLCLEDGAEDPVPMNVWFDYQSAREFADRANKSSIDAIFNVRGVRLVWLKSSCPHCGETLPPMADDLAFNYCPYCSSRFGEDDEAV